MVFFAQKVLRKVAGNWTFVVVTDRVELDDQIAKTFKATGAVSEAEGDQCHAESGAHLRELLRGNHRYVFTLIHKFQTPELLCDRPDVIVLTDEAHRSQYDTLALNMRAALLQKAWLAPPNPECSPSDHESQNPCDYLPRSRLPSVSAVSAVVRPRGRRAAAQRPLHRR